jgi:hypothetical protein
LYPKAGYVSSAGPPLVGAKLDPHRFINVAAAGEVAKFRLVIVLMRI